MYRIFRRKQFIWLGNVQKLPVNDFKWVKRKKLSKFSEDLIKNYDENSNKGYFLSRY